MKLLVCMNGCILKTCHVLAEFIIRVCQEGDIRLVGGVVEWEGSVEVCQDNEWGSVCDNSWTVRDAQVACRQLGYTEEGKGSSGLTSIFLVEDLDLTVI